MYLCSTPRIMLLANKWPISDMDWWRDRLTSDRRSYSQRTSLIMNSSLGNMTGYRWLYGKSWGDNWLSADILGYMAQDLINCTYWMCNSGKFASFLDRGVVFLPSQFFDERNVDYVAPIRVVLPCSRIDPRMDEELPPCKIHQIHVIFFKYLKRNI